jgi:hypothetical protein
MSAAHAESAPATAGAGRTARLARSIAGGSSLAAIAVAVTIAVWPASETEKARTDGESFGAAVAQLQSAQSAEDVDAALADMQDAVADTREHAGDEVADQVAAQEDALSRAADGFVGTHTSEDAFEVDLYQAELNTAVDDLGDNAEHFRTQGPEVRQAFWEGYQDGLNGS